MQFTLETTESDPGKASREFYYRLDQPTVFTATLEHEGSNAIAMIYIGGKRGLHGTRVDAEHGETMTIAVDITQSDIEEIEHGYWILEVINFDPRNGASARLVVNYNELESKMVSILPLPSDVSFEFINRHVQSLLDAMRAKDAATLSRVEPFLHDLYGVKRRPCWKYRNLLPRWLHDQRMEDSPTVGQGRSPPHHCERIRI